MPSLCWKYNLKIDVDETQRNAKGMGFNAIFLEGQSRTHHELYPLNQIKISGGTLCPDVKVHVGSKVTEIFYYAENFSGIDEIKRTLMDLDKAERTLNRIVSFASDEANRFGKDTEIPVASTSMLNLRIYLRNNCDKAMDSVQQVVVEEIEKAFADVAKGQLQCALLRLEPLIRVLEPLMLDLISYAKEDNDPRAEEWEAKLRKALSAMNSFS